MSLLEPISHALAAVLAATHDALTALGADPTAGATWLLCVAAVVVVLRLALLPVVEDPDHTVERFDMRDAERGPGEDLEFGAHEPARFPALGGELAVAGGAGRPLAAEVDPVPPTGQARQRVHLFDLAAVSDIHTVDVQERHPSLSSML